MEPRTRAFIELVRPHLRRLHVVARYYAERAEDAHDLVQETLLRARRAFSPAEGRTCERAWFFTILRHIAGEWRRAAGRGIRLVPLSETQLTEVVGPEPWEPFAHHQTLDEERFREFLDQRIAAALEALDPSFREVLILSVAGGMTCREIAGVLGCPIGTVMSRMGRARRAPGVAAMPTPGRPSCSNGEVSAALRKRRRDYVVTASLPAETAGRLVALVDSHQTLAEDSASVERSRRRNGAAEN